MLTLNKIIEYDIIEILDIIVLFSFFFAFWVNGP
jgi:hypothetical protein